MLYFPLAGSLNSFLWLVELNSSIKISDSISKIVENVYRFVPPVLIVPL